jgi:hypothetical protein
MDPIEVTVRFGPQGQITLLQFNWKGHSYLVESTGRRWTAADGQHILVMTGSGAMFELVFAPGEGRWYLRQAAPARTAA